MDIFGIKSANVVFKIGEGEYPFVDPPFLEKIVVRQKFIALRKQFEAEDSDVIEYSKKVFALNKQQIQLCIPTLGDEILDKMGDAAMLGLLKKLTQLSETEFGAVIEKVEAK